MSGTLGASVNRASCKYKAEGAIAPQTDAETLMAQRNQDALSKQRSHLRISTLRTFVCRVQIFTFRSYMESMEAAFSRKRSREEMMPRGVKSGARKVMAMGKTMTRSWCTTKTLTVLLLLSSQWSGSSALMSDALYRGGLFPKVRSLPRSSTTTTTIPRRMVLTTPESIIEQASTQNLLDYLIDESVRTSARGPIMMQFDPSSGWIWKRWRGTIFSETWDVCVKSMLYATAILVIFKQFPGLKEHISGFNVLWGQLLSVTTFTLTFFVNQSYALWRKCYELSRRLQGRLHDVGMTLAIHAERKVPSGPNEPSTYTPASRQILELVSRYVRLFNVLTYASFTRYDCCLHECDLVNLTDGIVDFFSNRKLSIQISSSDPDSQRDAAACRTRVNDGTRTRSSGRC